MSKVDGTGKAAPIIKSGKSEKVRRNKEKVDSLSSTLPKDRSLEEILIQYLKDIDCSDEQAVIETYVKSSLVWQLGHDVLNDVDYPKFFNGVVEKVKNSKAMRDSILKTLLEIDHG